MSLQIYGAEFVYMPSLLIQVLTQTCRYTRIYFPYFMANSLVWYYLMLHASGKVEYPFYTVFGLTQRSTPL
jgi:hypothetical protein